MDEQKKRRVYVDVSSSFSIRSLKDLLNDTTKSQIPIFEYGIGQCLKPWYKIKEKDEVIYCIDGVRICQGDIIFIKKKAFRPSLLKDHEFYKVFVDFARSMCSQSFDKDWQNFMIAQHPRATEQRKWLFVVYAIIKPTLSYHCNRLRLIEKVEQIEAAENDDKPPFEIYCMD